MFNDDMYSAVDLMIKLGVDPEKGIGILREIERSEPAKRASVISALSTLAERNSIIDATAKMSAYDKLCSELSSLNTMRGGAKGFKGFVGESMEAARSTVAGRSTSVVNNNGPVDLIFSGKNGVRGTESTGHDAPAPAAEATISADGRGIPSTVRGSPGTDQTCN